MEVVDVRHAVIVEFQAATGNTHGVNASHCCDVTKCKYWGSRRLHAYVCRASLHIHQCKRDCSISEKTSSGVYVCPISGIENAQVYMAYPSRVTARGGGERFVNTMTWQGTGGRFRKQKKKLYVSRCYSTQVASIISDILKFTAMQPVRSSVRTISFQQVMVKMFSDAAVVKPPPEDVCVQIAEYVNNVHTSLKPKPSTQILVAVVFSFLAAGLVLNDVCIFPVNGWCAARAPKLTAYALVPGLQCRPMSTATRALKRAVGAGGKHVSSIFIFPT
jgi:hypothetical protein